MFRRNFLIIKIKKKEEFFGNLPTEGTQTVNE